MFQQIIVSLLVVFSVFLFGTGFAWAKDLKIATISLENIVKNSDAGLKAKHSLEGKVEEFKSKLEKEQQDLENLKAEIEKKSSVWSNEVRGEKERDYQKKLRNFQVKSEDAQYELKQLEAKIMGPILKELHEAIAVVGKKNDYTIILENSRKGIQSQIGLMYADESLDISDLVQKELDQRLKPKDGK